MEGEAIKIDSNWSDEVIQNILNSGRFGTSEINKNFQSKEVEDYIFILKSNIYSQNKNSKKLQRKVKILYLN